MIVCPKCNNQNPEGATQCEGCFTPLPSTTKCPSCGETVQTDATFCGQCGYNLQVETTSVVKQEETVEIPETIVNESKNPVGEISKIKELSKPSSSTPSNSPPPATKPATPASDQKVANQVSPPPKTEQKLVEKPQQKSPAPPPTQPKSPAKPDEIPPTPPPSQPLPVNLKEEEKKNLAIPETADPESVTTLQVKTAKLLHVQTNKKIELPHQVLLVHIGKPNDQVPPHIDVSGFPNSDVVSRIHADIRVEGDNYYIEDVGSTNGTYINHSPLPVGNRHKLKAGDRIALGKEDKVTFIFQVS